MRSLLRNFMFNKTNHNLTLVEFKNSPHLMKFNRMHRFKIIDCYKAGDALTECFTNIFKKIKLLHF